jgi:UDP-N-acetylglucosamine 4,6-dehydratase
MDSIKNKRILVTGGTGSFGLFIVNRLLALGASEIRVFSRDEKKHYDLKLHYREEERINLILGDVRDRERVWQATKGCDLVFHAAALKHVNNCEAHPNEAVKTNVIGAQNVIDAAIACGIGRFVAVSTDKAVKPVNVMGMTKAVQERLVISANRLPCNTGTSFCCVRYGNVMNSRGSAIPYFRKLVGEKREITITHQEMTRFLLTLDDAIDLVMFAAEHMQGGEIFVKKAPATRIVDLAKVICEEAGVPFKQRNIGTFPGEKLHEILVSEEEVGRVQDLSDYFVVEPAWSTKRYSNITTEYSSDKNLVSSPAEIQVLLQKSDSEFIKYGLKNSVFLK